MTASISTVVQKARAFAPDKIPADKVDALVEKLSVDSDGSVISSVLELSQLLLPTVNAALLDLGLDARHAVKMLELAIMDRVTGFTSFADAPSEVEEETDASKLGRGGSHDKLVELSKEVTMAVRQACLDSWEPPASFEVPDGLADDALLDATQRMNLSAIAISDFVSITGTYPQSFQKRKISEACSKRIASKHLPSKDWGKELYAWKAKLVGIARQSSVWVALAMHIAVRKRNLRIVEIRVCKTLR